MYDILNLAREILQGRDLCDFCLGRQFAKLGHGLSNGDRGRAIRVLLSLEDDRPYQEQGFCELCLGNLPRSGQWAERALARLQGLEFKKFVVGSHLPEFLKEQERELQTALGLTHGGALKHDLNREVGKRLEKAFGELGVEAQVDLHNPEVAILLDLVWDRVELNITPLFVFGRYRKLLRGIPQTHWPCRPCQGRGCEKCNFTGKQYSQSVEELISPALCAAARGRSSCFHGSGREDIDARMLGKGRPFVVEIREPQLRDLDLGALEEEINHQAVGKVEVEGLEFTERAMVEHLKAARSEKLYQARVEFDRPVSKEELRAALGRLVGPIEQRTPRRVAHRRADRVRRRLVHEIEGELISDREALVKVKCASGLYVKELISGDQGRTKPNLVKVLNVPGRVVELDVLEVFDDLP